jgi:hypothetical protein
MEMSALGRFAAVEDALASAYRISKKDRSAFRARLTLLQRGGLLGRENQVGKGSAIDYGRDAAWRLIFAVELLEAGLPPSAILRIVKGRWTEEIAGLFEQAVESKSKAALLALAVSLMRDSWSNKLSSIVGLYDPQKGMVWVDREAESTSRSTPMILLNVAKRWRDFEAALKVGDASE